MLVLPNEGLHGQQPNMHLGDGLCAHNESIATVLDAGETLLFIETLLIVI